MAKSAEPQQDQMPMIALPSLASLALSGVYFLYLQGVVVYVGQAVDVGRRVGQHISEGLKEFDAVTCIPAPVAGLERLERHYIGIFLPEHNKCGYSNALRYAAQAAVALPAAECKPHMNAQEAAAFLGISIETLRAAERRGEGPRRQRMRRCRKQVYPFAELRKYAGTLAG